MNILRITVTGILLLAFTMNIIAIAQEGQLSPDELVDDIEEYNGSIGPDNALYGLKLAFEGLDESFTLNSTERLEKKIYHSRLRISEAKTELKNKNDGGAKKAFEHYEEKINQTEESMVKNRGNDSGMIYAQKKIDKNQYALERLLELHPNNTGLLNAYNKSVELEDRFEEKTQMKLERVLTEEGKHYLKEVKTEKKEEKEGNDLTSVQIHDVPEIKAIQDGSKQEEKDTKLEEKNKGPEKKTDIKEGRDQHDARQDRNDKRGN